MALPPGAQGRRPASRWLASTRMRLLTFARAFLHRRHYTSGCGKSLTEEHSLISVVDTKVATCRDLETRRSS